MNFTTTKVLILLIAALALLFRPQRGPAADAWRAEWDKTVKAAALSGQTTAVLTTRGLCAPLNRPPPA